MSLPRIVHVKEEVDSDGSRYLIAERKKDGLEGRVGTYELIDEYDARSVTEIRKKGTKTWFK